MKTKFVPKLVNRVSDKELKVVWDDDKEVVYTFRDLRFACQCALCKHEITGEKLVKIEDIPEDINLVNANVVGNYALSLTWSDNHSTGIYTYDYLRVLGDS